VIPLVGFKTLLSGVQSGALPRGKSLNELMGIALQQFEQDRKEFAQEYGGAAEEAPMSRVYGDPLFEEGDDSKAAVNPLGMQLGDSAPSEFETWMASKYGGQPA